MYKENFLLFPRLVNGKKKGGEMMRNLEVSISY